MRRPGLRPAHHRASAERRVHVRGVRSLVVFAFHPGGDKSVLQDLHAKPLESWIVNLIQLLRIKYRDDWLVVCENTKCW